MKNLKITTGLILIASSHIINLQAHAASPPWYTVRSQLAATFKKDPCVKVAMLTGTGRDMHVDVNVCEYNKAQGLATFISHQYDYGDKLRLSVDVYYNNMLVKPATINDIESLFSYLQDALKDNPYFVRVGANRDMGIAEFKPMVIQYFSDDISDAYGNTNLVAAQAFKSALHFDEFIKQGYRVFTTTSLIKDIENN